MIKSVYIHIPFCNKICSYCDFCKIIYNKKWVDDYLIHLEKEIKSKYEGEIIETIYIGGGTPSSLDMYQLNKLFEIIKIFNKSEICEFTFECNLESLTEEKVELFKVNGVNRISIGIETFNDRLLKYLNRDHSKDIAKYIINLIKKVGISNINIDLIYAIPGETLEDLNNDLEQFLNLDITHISSYSLIIEPHTNLYIKKQENIDEELDYEMYNLICEKLQAHGYNHYEISNFSKEGFESKHNLTYWNNEEYYGFGMGASGYINGVRYDNSRSLNKYLNGEYVMSEKKLTKKETLENEFILGFRKINGINKNNFYKKYKKNITDIETVKQLIYDEKLIENNEYVYINHDFIYTSNDILINFID